jgi:hypothetical protein
MGGSQFQRAQRQFLTEASGAIQKAGSMSSMMFAPKKSSASLT